MCSLTVGWISKAKSPTVLSPLWVRKLDTSFALRGTGGLVLALHWIRWKKCDMVLCIIPLQAYNKTGRPQKTTLWPRTVYMCMFAIYWLIVWASAYLFAWVLTSWAVRFSRGWEYNQNLVKILTKKTLSKSNLPILVEDSDVTLEDSVSSENNHHKSVRRINVNSENFHSFTLWEKQISGFVCFGFFLVNRRVQSLHAKFCCIAFCHFPLLLKY